MYCHIMEFVRTTNQKDKNISFTEVRNEESFGQTQIWTFLLNQYHNHSLYVCLFNGLNDSINL